MATSIRIEDSLYNEAKVRAKVEFFRDVLIGRQEESEPFHFWGVVTVQVDQKPTFRRAYRKYIRINSLTSYPQLSSF